jgi:uncharacterized membrane protein YccC
VIDPDTKSNLTFQLGQLVKAIAKRQDDVRQDALAMVAARLDLAARRHSLSEEVVNHFLELLRDGNAEIIREMKALTDNNMPEDSDEEMQGNNSVASSNVAMADSGSSSDGSSSNEQMPDALSEGSDGEWG